MRIAWFQPSPQTAGDDARAVPPHVGLAAAHVLDRYDERTAHDFVWRQARHPYDLCVYELGTSPSYTFVRAYLFHYPGVLVLHGSAYDRPAIEASRLVVVEDGGKAEVLAAECPGRAVREMPIGVADSGRTPIRDTGPLRLSVLAPTQRDLAERAVARARAAGADATVAPLGTSGSLTADADVIVAMEWPPTAATLDAAMRGMSAGTPVIVFETDATASWPALDPQTWQPRGYGPSAPPIVISIDPRDAEHSLFLAVRRLAADPALRSSLGTAGRRWWAEHGTLERAAAAWQTILDDAQRQPLPRPDNLPPALTADGTERARDLLAPFGITVDVLQ